MFKYFILLSMLFLTSCINLQINGPRRSFPSHLKNECNGALNYAENIIKQVGVHKIKDKNIEVRLISGRKNLGKKYGWSFIYPPTGMEVLGICVNNGSLIYLGVNPNNNSDINIPTLRHEMAHHWLLSNGHTDMHHYPIYDKHFEGWADGRRVTGLTDDKDFKILHYNMMTTNGIISVTQVVRIN
jgi:hypothetical protein